MDLLDAAIQGELAKRVSQLQDDMAQITAYADALNERCINDTAEIGRLRSWATAAVQALQSIDSDGECHASMAAIRDLIRQGAGLLSGNDMQTPNAKLNGGP